MIVFCDEHHIKIKKADNDGNEGNEGNTKDKRRLTARRQYNYPVSLDGVGVDGWRTRQMNRVVEPVEKVPIY